MLQMGLIKRIFANGWQSISGGAAAFWALLTPAIPAAVASFVFIFADLFFGIKVSRKYGNKHIESRRLWSTLNKITEALVLVILGLCLDHFIFLEDDMIAVRVAAGAVCTAEAFSMLESLRALYPNAILSKILQKVVKSKAEKYLDVNIDDIIENKVEVTDDTKTSN